MTMLGKRPCWANGLAAGGYAGQMNTLGE